MSDQTTPTAAPEAPEDESAQVSEAEETNDDSNGATTNELDPGIMDGPGK